jgi:hypothetical protein
MAGNAAIIQAIRAYLVGDNGGSDFLLGTLNIKGLGYDWNRIIQPETGIPVPVNPKRNCFKELRFVRTGFDV